MKVHGVRALSLRIGDPTIHEAGPPPVPPLLPHLDAPHTVKWLSPLSAKMAESVEFDDSRVIQQGHDTGSGIPHITIPNALLAVVILFSSYKFHFGASRVKAEGQPVAGFKWGLAPPLTCTSPVSAPSLSGILHGSTVQIGFTTEDFLSGWGNLFVDMLTDFLWSGFGPLAEGLWKGIGRYFWKDLAEPFARRFLSRLSNTTLREMLIGIINEYVNGLIRRLILGPAFGIWSALPLRVSSLDMENGTVRTLEWQRGTGWTSLASPPPRLPRFIDDFQNEGVRPARGLPRAH